MEIIITMEIKVFKNNNKTLYFEFYVGEGVDYDVPIGTVLKFSVKKSITDSDDVALHIKKHFLFISQIPQLEEYLKMILNSFFRTARILELEIEKCRMQECKKL